ncbi:MAG: DNA translocase FtsK [Candidatus Aminicenantes bacterium]|nr:DNA translocase FtsK [Candidatus Aminicenantes bacterium]
MKKRKKATSEAEPASSSVGQKKQLLVELIGLLCLALALFAALSLISYNIHDPSWAQITPPKEKIHNYGGRVGAYLADSLLIFFGLSAFLIPFLLALIFFRMLKKATWKKWWLSIASMMVLLLILTPLSALLFPQFRWGGGEIQPGGLLGHLLASLLLSLFNRTGSLIFLGCSLLLFLLLTTEFSLQQLLSVSQRFCQLTLKEIHLRVARFQQTKSKVKMRQKILEKYAPPVQAAEKIKSKSPEGKVREKIKDEEKIIPPRDKGTRTEVKEPSLTSPLSPELASRKEEKLLFPELVSRGGYHFPPFNLLEPGQPAEQIDRNELYEKKIRIEEKLKEFKVEGEVREYHPGPVITTYEFYPNPGIKVSQVASLAEDLSLALGAESVRIQRIPGKSSLGVEIPNNKREIIRLRDIIQSEKFIKSPSKLTFALGKTVHGEVYVTDLAIMPHLLIAGATGTGKSVCLNALIASILYKATPEEVKLILIDPKRLEFTLYEGIPHLLSPVVNDPKKAGPILMDAIRKMKERLDLMYKMKVRNIEQYNSLVKQILEEKKGRLSPEEKEKLKPLPYIVIIIDELAELMMVGAQEIDYCITRLSQLARAVGIHLVMATQRPSIDVITGTIKNNFSCRIAFRVPSKVDSRIIIDTVGAEKLLGLGDMLFLPPNYPRLIRLHCAYISVAEITRLVKFVREQGAPSYDENLIKVIKSTPDELDLGYEEKDELYEKAVELVLVTGQASASYLQRRLKLGYNRAARIIDQMEREGIIGPSEGSKPREILVDPQTYLKQLKRGN